MNTYTKIRPARVIGPLGLLLTMETLPPPGTVRWVIRRKAEVLAAINGGLLSIVEACERYDLSLEELMLWQSTVERSGVPGLRVKHIKRYRLVVSQQDKQQALSATAALVDGIALTDRDAA